jgi:hypothetical protein
MSNKNKYPEIKTEKVRFEDFMTDFRMWCAYLLTGKESIWCSHRTKINCDTI